MLKQILAEPPPPAKIASLMKRLDHSPKPIDPVQLSTYHRAWAALALRSRWIDFSAVRDALNKAILAVQGIPSPEALEAQFNARFNLATSILDHMDTRLRRESFYEQGISSEPFGQLLELSQEIQTHIDLLSDSAAQDSPQEYELRYLTARTLAWETLRASLELAHAKATGNTTRLAELAGELEAYRDGTEHAFRSLTNENSGQPKDVSRAALSRLIIHIDTFPKPNNDLPDLLKQFEEGIPTISDPITRAADTALALDLRIKRHTSESPGEDNIINLLNLGEQLMESLGSQQTQLVEQGNYMAAQTLLDDYGLLSSIVVEGWLAINKPDQAFLAAQRAKWSSMRPATSNLTLAATVDQLTSSNELLIEYFLTREHVISFWVDQSGLLATQTCNLSRYDLTQHLKKFVLATQDRNRTFERHYKLATPNQQTVINNFHDSLRRGTVIYRELLPLLKEISEKHDYERIVIVPHLSLHYLSFPTLPTFVPTELGDVLKDTRFVIDDFPALAILPTSIPGDRQLRNERANSSNGFYLYRDRFPNEPLKQLKYPKLEVNRSREFYPATIFSNHYATETQFKSHASTADFFVLTTHGKANRESPFSSYLALAGSPEDDGRLTVSEILDLARSSPIQASWAVLGACDTSLSDERPLFSDDLPSLTRAFLAHGIPEVLGTLWPARDKIAAEIVPATLKYKSQGHAMPEALHLAQRDYLNTRRNSDLRQTIAELHPAHWAPFVAYTQWNTTSSDDR